MMMVGHNIQSSTGYSERITFTGKERDEETGYGYFGARYMEHELMTMWLSVDPMADKYPSISPYAYCAWNPVKLVDPDGKEVDDYFSKDGKYLGSDDASTDFVRIMDEQDWNDAEKNENHQISHENGVAHSTLCSETSLNVQSALNIYRHYWSETGKNNNDVEIKIESENNSKHYMQAHSIVKRKKHWITINLQGMMRDKFSDHIYCIISLFEHEDRHISQHKNIFLNNGLAIIYPEWDALHYQVCSNTFSRCPMEFQTEFRERLRQETPLFLSID